MSAVGRAAFRATRTLRIQHTAVRRAASEKSAASAVTGGTAEERRSVAEQVLKKGAKRDPELYILLTVMTGAFGLAGYYFASKPTSSTSESAVTAIIGSEPWQTGSSGKYQYHPGGDSSQPAKDAPSALHSVVVPDVTLPKYLHDHFNKYDNEEFDDY